MQQHPSIFDPADSSSETRLRRMLAGMSVFTMLMTIPQVLSIWIGHQAGGISLLTWGTYFFPRSCGSGSDCENETRISICPASDGSCWIAP